MTVVGGGVVVVVVLPPPPSVTRILPLPLPPISLAASAAAELVQPLSKAVEARSSVSDDTNSERTARQRGHGHYLTPRIVRARVARPRLDQGGVLPL